MHSWISGFAFDRGGGHVCISNLSNFLAFLLEALRACSIFSCRGIALMDPVRVTRGISFVLVT